MKSYFVAGTDTSVGKTLISASLLHLAESFGFSTIGLKPIAAGCEQVDNSLRNSDALLLQAHATIKLPYAQVNPIALKEPVSPHIAAQIQGAELSVQQAVDAIKGAMAREADLCLVEGAGGWRVPINASETMADLAKSLSLPVILVVGIRLGCINHGLLTLEAMVKDGLTPRYWVANIIERDMQAVVQNISTLKAHMPCPLLGTVPYFDEVKIVNSIKYLALPDL